MSSGESGAAPSEHAGADSETGIKHPDPQTVADLVVLFMIARDLFQIRRDYPAQLSESECREWVDGVLIWATVILKASRFESILRLQESEDFLELNDADQVQMLMFSALFAHPAMSEPGSTPTETQTSVEEALLQCQRAASALTKEKAAQLTTFMVESCRCPSTDASIDFAQPSRFLQMLNLYWRLASSLVAVQTSVPLGFKPHPLLHYLENILDRIRTCFTKLNHLEGAADARQTCDYLIELLIEGGIDELCEVPECTSGQLQEIEQFIARSNLKLGGREFSLTAPERFFISQCEQLIADHRKRAESQWHRVLERIDATAGASASQQRLATSPSQHGPVSVKIDNWAESETAITEAIKAASAQALAIESAQKVGAPAQRTPAQQPSEGTDWLDVQRRLLELYERRESYTSVAKLATLLGCAGATVQKAFKPPQSSLERLDQEERAEARSTARKLAGWQARTTKVRVAPRATSINDMVMDNAEQTCEVEPAKEAEGADWEIEFARLIEDAQPGERAKLNAMEEEQRKELVAVLREDPDRYDRLLGRKA